MPTPNQPLPRWRLLSDGWHVEIVHGATRTACNQEVRAAGPASDTPVPTHCARCRLHYRAAKQAAADAAAAAKVAKVAKAAPKPKAPAGQGQREAAVLTLLLQGGPLPPCPEDDPDGELALVCLLQHDGERHVAEAVVRHRGASGREAYWALPDDTPAVAPELVAWAWLRGPDAPEVSA